MSQGQKPREWWIDKNPFTERVYGPTTSDDSSINKVHVIEKSAYDDLVERFEKKCREIEVILQDYNAVVTQLKAYEGGYHGALADLKALEAERDALAKNFVSITEYQDLEIENAALKASLQTSPLIAENRALKAELARAADDLQKRYAVLRGIEQERDQLKAELAELGRQCGVAEGFVDDLSEERDRLRQALKYVRDLIDRHQLISALIRIDEALAEEGK